MIDIKTFKNLLGKTQSELKLKIEEFIKSIGYKPIIGDGFIYAKGEIPILLVAHMDTVHKVQPTQIYYDSEQKVMWSPQGIGGDDRCGVYTILKIISEYTPHILFTEDEEIGGVGAKKTVEALKKPDVKFIIEIDRRGSDDCVFYDCGNKEFQEYIESFGFKSKWGTYSDICELSREWNIASVNLSAGYYNEHTTSETINIDDLESIYDRIVEILEDDINNKKYFDYQEIKYTPKTYYPSTQNKKTNNQKFYKNDYYQDKYGYEDEYGIWHWWDDEYDLPEEKE